MFMEFLHTFILSFIPVFVAMDPVGILPLYISFTKDMDFPHRRRVTVEALGTALVVTVVFMFVGRGIFRVLGITLADFQIAGGLLLLLISILDMVSSTKEMRDPGSQAEVGVVPLGIPLIAGPAVLTTELLLLQQYGLPATAAALIVNLALAWLGFRLANNITRILGQGGVRAISKVISLLLAAIAVMMIRLGVQTIIKGGGG